MVLRREQVKIIKSKLLSKYPEILSAMSTRNGGASPAPYGMNLSYNAGDDRKNVDINRERFFGKLNIRRSSLAIPGQVHGDSVVFADVSGDFPECDALVTNKKDVFLVVTIADCQPILLFDPETCTIAAVHVGWRGSRVKILPRSVQAMNSRFSVKSEHLVAYIGPSAGICCYEVGEEVAHEFDRRYVEKRNGKFYLDLKRCSKDLLLICGLIENNIEISGSCTICNPTLFHSYRREKEKSGRMMAVIGIVE